MATKNPVDVAGESFASLPVEPRRELVAGMYVAGWSHRQIAAQIGVSSGTISRDVKAIRKMWYESAVDEFRGFAGKQMHQYNVLLNAIWGDATGGDLGAMDRVVRIMENQASLYGMPHHFNIPQMEQTADDDRAMEGMPTLDDFLAKENVREIQFREMIFAFTNEDGTVDGVEGGELITT